MTWYAGGLDHQIDFNIENQTDTTLVQAVRSHFRWLAKTGDA